jgi:hypothetical protein
MIKMTSFGLAMAVGAGLWGAACSSSSSSGTTGDDAGTGADAAGDTSVADSAPQDSALADTAPAADSAPADGGGDAGPVCADMSSTACTACIQGAATGTCSSQYTACETDDSGTSDAAATSGLSCKGIVECLGAGGSANTCASEGTTVAQSDIEALAMCLDTACPSASIADPTNTHALLIPLFH